MAESIKEIAHFLGVSERQVERLRNSIFQKLDCKDIAQSVAQGIRFGELVLPSWELYLGGRVVNRGMVGAVRLERNHLYAALMGLY